MKGRLRIFRNWFCRGAFKVLILFLAVLFLPLGFFYWLWNDDGLVDSSFYIVFGVLSRVGFERTIDRL